MGILELRDLITVAGFLVGAGIILGQFRSHARLFAEHTRDNREQFTKINDTLGQLREDVAELRGRQA